MRLRRESGDDPPPPKTTTKAPFLSLSMAFSPERLDDDITSKISMTMMINWEAVDIPLNMFRVMVEMNGRSDRLLAWTQRLITRKKKMNMIKWPRAERSTAAACATPHRTACWPFS